MEREVRRFMWVMIGIGCAFGVAVGWAADDMGMIRGALAAAVGSALVVPFVARMWKA